ncbi:hypothetical protein AgCh_029074 [Apium graveolens]
MESPAERRIQAIQQHLCSDHTHTSLLRCNETAGEFVLAEQGYSVILPEKLETGKWEVYRSVLSPMKLVSKFPNHPEIGTLHDNFTRSAKNFRDYKYLGTRVRVDGTVGEYKWMTYGEAAAARSAIGSGLLSLGIQKVVGGIDDQIPSLPSTTGVEIMSYSKLISQGQSHLHPFCAPTPTDTATICYTSGTTGTPKDNLKLLDDMAILRPTVFSSVPRLYNRIYAGITNAVKASGWLKERLFNAAYNAKKQAILSGKNPSPMWERLVFNKIKEKLGGRLRYIVSGASPLSPDVMEFLRVCFGQVVEGYGMTETACLISALDKDDILIGHVGAPSPSCEVKLKDVPEMNYTSDDQPHPRGEICVRGPIVFQGYYKDEVQTREVIDGDGWFHTGDIGLWLPGGRLKIIDRKKNIFKLAQGEYIAPEKIENVYSKCKFVAQCFVYGDSLNSSLVAVVSIDPDVFKAWAVAEGFKSKNMGELCKEPRARAAVLADMDAVGREAQLRGFEFAKAVALVFEPFTLENGLLTPTFKIKRHQAKAYFAKSIADLYAEIAATDSSSQK